MTTDVHLVKSHELAEEATKSSKVQADMQCRTDPDGVIATHIHTNLSHTDSDRVSATHIHTGLGRSIEAIVAVKRYKRTKKGEPHRQ